MAPKRRYSYMDITKVDGLLLCCICKEPFVDPVTTEDDRQGCRACLIELYPTCQPITQRIILQMVNGLLVKCLQCGETDIRRGELEKHQQNDCEQAIVSCESLM